MKRTSRHRTLRLLLAGGFVLGASQQAFPWGAEGHRAIGESAQDPRE